MILIYVVLAWTAGIVFAEHVDPNVNLPLIVAFFLLPAIFYLRKEKPTLLVLVLFFMLGIVRFELARPALQDDHIVHLNDQGMLTLQGVIVGEPEVLDSGLRIRVKVSEAIGKPASGQLLAYVPRESDLHYGDEVRLFGQVVTPPEFDSFSYQEYLARQGIFSLMPGAEVEVLRADQGNPFYKTLLNIKDRARNIITSSLSEPQASLLEGILLGDETGISDETAAAFVKTGTSHIIAISGFNMVLLAQTLLFFIEWVMPKRRLTGAWVGVSAILLYTLLVGAGGAVVRAAVMSSLLIIGKSIHRKTYVPTSMALAVLLLSAYDPWSLWNVGFQLSLAAVLGMTIFVPYFQKGLRWLVEKRLKRETPPRLLSFLSDSFFATLAAQITTLPLILYYFGRLSVVSLLVNFLIIPVQPYILLLGGSGVLIGLAIQPLGELILTGAWVFLSWTVEVVEAFAGLSWADRELHLGAVPVLIFFALLLGWVLYRATRPRWLKNLQVPVWTLVGVEFITLILLINMILARPDGKLHAHFLDRGAIFETPQGAVILVDGGSFPTRLLDSLGEALPDRERRIDVLVITSPETEMNAALPEVIKRYEIGTVLLGEPSDLIPQFQARQIPVVMAVDGYRMQTEDGVRLEVLYTEESLVLRVSYDQAVFLLTSTVTAEAEQQLLKNPHLLQAAVFASQGRDQANTAPLTTVVNPQITIFQVGEDQNIAPVVVDRLSNSQQFQAKQGERVEIITDGTNLWANSP